MKQSNECGNVSNYEIFSLPLRPGAEPRVSLVSRHHPHPLTPSTKTINQKETKNPE